MANSRGRVKRYLLHEQWGDVQYRRTLKEAVEQYYGSRLQIEAPDGERLVWRLSIYGRTIGCSDDPREAWQEAFDDLLGLLEDDQPHPVLSSPQAYGGPVIYV